MATALNTVINPDTPTTYTVPVGKNLVFRGFRSDDVVGQNATVAINGVEVAFLNRDSASLNGNTQTKMLTAKAGDVISVGASSSSGVGVKVVLNGFLLTPAS